MPTTSKIPRTAAGRSEAASALLHVEAFGLPGTPHVVRGSGNAVLRHLQLCVVVSACLSQALQLGVFLLSADVDALAELRIVELVGDAGVVIHLRELARRQRGAAGAGRALRGALRLLGETRFREDLLRVGCRQSLDRGAS